MKLMKGILSVGVVALLISSCNNSPKKETENTALPLEKLTNYLEADKQQLFFRLTDEVSTDSSVVYTGRSVFEQDTVAIQVEVLKNIKPGLNSEGQVDEENGFSQGAIRISSIGVESDAFVKALGKMFKLPTEGKMTSSILMPTVFSSNKEAVDVGKNATYSFKLFFDNKKGTPAEMFAVLDTYKKSFELSEKDSTFRGQIISAFEDR